MYKYITNYSNYGVYSNLIRDGSLTLVVNRDITKETWSDHFFALHNIITDGIDDDDFANLKINFILDDGNQFRLSPFDYWINLILWNLIISAGEKIEGKHIFFPKTITAKSIKRYIDVHFIANHKSDIDLKLKNNMIADTLKYITLIDEFSVLFANSINLQDEVLMMKAIPEYYDLLHPDMSNIHISDVKNVGMENIRKIEEYVMNSKKYIGYDHMYTNAFRAKESINTKQLREYAVNIGTKPDGQGGVFTYIIPNSFINGGVTDLASYLIESSSGRTAQIQSKMNVGKSGAFARRMGLNNQDSFLHPDPDYCCDTRNFIQYEIKNEKILNSLVDRYYRLDPHGFDNIIKSSDKFLIGKKIYVRSPITCASNTRGEGICRFCYGDLYYINKNINIGKFAAEDTTSKFTQRQLSAKHLLDTDINKIKWSELFLKNFIINEDNSISCIDDKDYKDTFIKFNLNEIFQDNEDDIYDEEYDDTSSYNDYVSNITIVQDSNENLIEIQGIDKFYLSKDLIKEINKKKYINDNEESIIPLKNLANMEDNTLFYIQIQNNELSRTLSLAKDILDKVPITTSFTKDTIAQEYNEVIIKGGIDVMAVHGELIIANQIRSANDIYELPDWTNENEPYQLLSLSKALAKNPSITKTLDFQDLKKTLRTPSSFNRTNSSTIDYFFQEQPQKFMKTNLTKATTVKKVINAFITPPKDNK